MVRSRPGPADRPPRTGPQRPPGRAGPSGPGRCWSWPPRPRPRCGPGGSASRRRPGSAWSPRCRASGPRCTWTPPSPSRSASRPTRRTRCAPGWPAIRSISGRTRRFAKWSAICSFALGMAGQVAYHLMAQAGMARAPWAITTLVSCLPVLVLGMGTALAHLLRADAEATDTAGSRTGQPAVPRSVSWSRQDQAGPGRRGPVTDRDRSVRRDRNGPEPGPRRGRGVTGSGMRPAGPQVDQARVIARRLAAAGKPVSRRALRSGGVTGSNQALNALARIISTELAGYARRRVTRPGVRRACLPASQPASQPARIWPGRGGVPDRGQPGIGSTATRIRRLPVEHSFARPGGGYA